MTTPAIRLPLTITGQALTEIARRLMLSEEPAKAWRILADGLVGEGSETAARRVLSGEYDLDGDSGKGFTVVDAEPEAASEYLRDLRYIYAGRVRLHGCWCRPRGIVSSYGQADALAAGPVTAGPLRMGRRRAWGLKRAEFYAEPGERVAWVAKAPEELSETGDAYIVFEPCGEPPHWLHPLADPEAALADAFAAGRSIEPLGAFAHATLSAQARMMSEGLSDEIAEELIEAAEAAEEEARAAALAAIGQAVRDQAGDNLLPLTLRDGRVIQVPAAPFTHWALRRLPSVDRDTLPPWTPVSRSGVKLQCDDPYHTDWVLGAGLTIQEGYHDNVSGPAWDLAAEMQFAQVDDRD